jgi:glycosidase
MLLLARRISVIKDQSLGVDGYLIQPIIRGQDYGGYDVKDHLFLDRTP